MFGIHVFIRCRVNPRCILWNIVKPRNLALSDNSSRPISEFNFRLLVKWSAPAINLPALYCIWFSLYTSDCWSYSLLVHVLNGLPVDLCHMEPLQLEAGPELSTVHGEVSGGGGTSWREAWGQKGRLVDRKYEDMEEGRRTQRKLGGQEGGVTRRQAVGPGGTR